MLLTFTHFVTESCGYTNDWAIDTMSERYDLSLQLRPLDVVRATVEGRVPESLEDGKEMEGVSYPAVFAAVVHTEGGREAGWCVDICSLFTSKLISS